MLNKIFSIGISGLLISLSSGCGQNNSLNGNISETTTINTFAGKTVKSGQELTLATYNIKNLFSNSKTEKQKVALSKAIHEIKSDIIAFEEVESSTIFKTFTNKYLKDMNYNLFINDSPGKVKVAVLSRFPISEIKNTLISKTKSNKSVIPADTVCQLNMKVSANYSFTLFVAYLKSLNTPGYTPEKRNVDINNMKSYIKDFQTLEVNYAVLANFNDKPDTPAFQPFLDPRASGMNFHDVVSEDLGKGADIYTVLNPQNKIRADYLLVSAGMFNEYITNSVIIHKPVKDGNNWENLFFQEASDHLPITAKFDISKDN